MLGCEGFEGTASWCERSGWNSEIKRRGPPSDLAAWTTVADGRLRLKSVILPGSHV
jgi:hypothetical protein